MTIYAEMGAYYFFYAIDNETGIVYIMLDSPSRCGITAAYNSDGSIMTVDDLKEKQKWRLDNDG